MVPRPYLTCSMVEPKPGFLIFGGVATGFGPTAWRLWYTWCTRGAEPHRLRQRTAGCSRPNYKSSQYRGFAGTFRGPHAVRRTNPPAAGCAPRRWHLSISARGTSFRKRERMDCFRLPASETAAVARPTQIQTLLRARHADVAQAALFLHRRLRNRASGCAETDLLPCRQ